MPGFKKFTNKTDGFRAALKYHYCTRCRYHRTEIFKECPECGSRDRIFFPSRAEMVRGASLLLQQSEGMIEKLRFHPKYSLKVNGIEVCTYTADAEYYRAGVLVVEDTKPENFIDATAIVKMKLFQAVYGFPVTIPQQQK